MASRMPCYIVTDYPRFIREGRGDEIAHCFADPGVGERLRAEFPDFISQHPGSVPPSAGVDPIKWRENSLAKMRANLKAQAAEDNNVSYPDGTDAMAAGFLVCLVPDVAPFCAIAAVVSACIEQHPVQDDVDHSTDAPNAKPPPPVVLADSSCQTAPTDFKNQYLICGSLVEKWDAQTQTSSKLIDLPSYANQPVTGISATVLGDWIYVLGKTQDSSPVIYISNLNSENQEGDYLPLQEMSPTGITAWSENGKSFLFVTGFTKKSDGSPLAANQLLSIDGNHIPQFESLVQPEGTRRPSAINNPFEPFVLKNSQGGNVIGYLSSLPAQQRKQDLFLGQLSGTTLAGTALEIVTDPGYDFVPLIQRNPVVLGDNKDLLVVPSQKNGVALVSLTQFLQGPIPTGLPLRSQKIEIDDELDLVLTFQGQDPWTFYALLSNGEIKQIKLKTPKLSDPHIEIEKSSTLKLSKKLNDLSQIVSITVDEKSHQVTVILLDNKYTSLTYTLE